VDQIPVVQAKRANGFQAEWKLRNKVISLHRLQTAPYTYGDAGRDSLLSPGYTDVDFSLMRNFMFREHYNAQFRAEAFNVLNHPNFGQPDATLEDANFGRITSINGFPREYQLAATFKF